MKILRDDEVPPLPDGGGTYRDIDWAGLVVGSIASGLTLAALSAPLLTGAWSNGWIVAAAFAGALFAAFFARFGINSFRASRAPEAWVMCWAPESLWLRFRSYHNHRFPPDTPSVVELSRKEVAWLRKYAQEVKLPASSSLSRRTKIEGIEIGLRNTEIETLAQALKEEAQRRDHRNARFNHYPVTLSQDGILRVELRNPEGVMAELETYYASDLDSESSIESAVSMTTAEKEELILTLAQAGRTIAAVEAARDLYGCDLTTAKQLVDGLMAKS